MKGSLYNVGLVARIIAKDIFPHHRVKGPQIYSAQEVHTKGDVGQSIARIYAMLNNTQTNHGESIIEMEVKLCDKVVSILIDLGSNYSYANPDLVDNSGLNREVHA